MHRVTVIILIAPFVNEYSKVISIISGLLVNENQKRFNTAASLRGPFRGTICSIESGGQKFPPRYLPLNFRSSISLTSPMQRRALDRVDAVSRSQTLICILSDFARRERCMLIC